MRQSPKFRHWKVLEGVGRERFVVAVGLLLFEDEVAAEELVADVADISAILESSGESPGGILSISGTGYMLYCRRQKKF